MLGSFVAGFAAGWFVRGTVESSHGATVRVLAAAMAAVDRVKRAVSIERDHLEDLVAEARARADVLRAERRAPRPRAGTDPLDRAAE